MVNQKIKYKNLNFVLVGIRYQIDIFSKIVLPRTSCENNTCKKTVWVEQGKNRRLVKYYPSTTCQSTIN